MQQRRGHIVGARRGGDQLGVRTAGYKLRIGGAGGVFGSLITVS